MLSRPVQSVCLGGPVGAAASGREAQQGRQVQDRGPCVTLDPRCTESEAHLSDSMCTCREKVGTQPRDIEKNSSQLPGRSWLTITRQLAPERLELRLKAAQARSYLDSDFKGYRPPLDTQSTGCM